MSVTPQCCGGPMRGVIADALPRGLRLWVCDVCTRRQWFYYGESVTDGEAMRVASEADALAAAKSGPDPS